MTPPLHKGGRETTRGEQGKTEPKSQRPKVGSFLRVGTRHELDKTIRSSWGKACETPARTGYDGGTSRCKQSNGKRWSSEDDKGTPGFANGYKSLGSQGKTITAGGRWETTIGIFFVGESSQNHSAKRANWILGNGGLRLGEPVRQDTPEREKDQHTRTQRTRIHCPESGKNELGDGGVYCLWEPQGCP